MNPTYWCRFIGLVIGYVRFRGLVVISLLYMAPAELAKKMSKCKISQNFKIFKLVYVWAPLPPYWINIFSRFFFFLFTFLMNFYCLASLVLQFFLVFEIWGQMCFNFVNFRKIMTCFDTHHAITKRVAHCPTPPYSTRHYMLIIQ